MPPSITFLRELLMNFLRNFFHTVIARPKPEDLAQISRKIEISIDSLAKKIFYSHQDQLLAESITFIVPAVWGTGDDGNLTDSQKAIRTEVVPVLAQVLLSFNSGRLSKTELFAIGSLSRALLISKVAFMIEAHRNRPISKITSSVNEAVLMQTIGTA